MSEITKLLDEEGGLPSAAQTSNPAGSLSSNVAAIAWYYFAENDFNPYSP